MTHFVKLSDGSWVNLAHVVKLHSNSRANRIEYYTGASHTLTDEDAEKLREAMRSPRRAKQPAKT